VAWWFFLAYGVQCCAVLPKLLVWRTHEHDLETPLLQLFNFSKEEIQFCVLKLDENVNQKKSQADTYFSMTEQTKANKVIKYSLTQLFFFISSLILVIDTLCCLNFEAGDVFGTFILAKLGIMLLWRHLWLKYILALQLYIFF